MATPTHIRLPEDVDRALAAHARRVGAGKSSVISQAVSEWLRMEAHPGVVFVQTVTGERRAALAAGPQIWTVAASWLQHDRDDRAPAIVADALGLAPREVEIALGYWADHRAEIDGVIERHRSAQDEALAAWERRQALASA